MRNIIRIGAGTDRRNRFVAIALGVALAAGPAAMLPAAALAAPATDAAAASTTAGTTITLQGADGASLAGHTFNVYRIGTYTDQILNGTQISSLGVGVRRDRHRQRLRSKHGRRHRQGVRLR